eukprot:117151-Chlamydomonas_euryale.AAC.1
MAVKCVGAMGSSCGEFRSSGESSGVERDVFKLQGQKLRVWTPLRLRRRLVVESLNVCDTGAPNRHSRNTKNVCRMSVGKFNPRPRTHYPQPPTRSALPFPSTATRFPSSANRSPQPPPISPQPPHVPLIRYPFLSTATATRSPQPPLVPLNRHTLPSTANPEPSTANPQRMVSQTCKDVSLPQTARARIAGLGPAADSVAAMRQEMLAWQSAVSDRVFTLEGTGGSGGGSGGGGGGAASRG